MSAKIRQEINILDSILSAAGGSSIVSNEVVQLDTTQYVNPTYYFEIVGDSSISISFNVTLRRKGTSTDDATCNIPLLTTAYTRVRSASFTPPAGQTEYEVFIDTTAGATKNVKAARIIIIDNPTNFTSSETQIEIGNNETGKTNTALAALTNPKYWLYTAANWDATKTFYAEVTYAMSTTKVTGTIKLQEDNGSFASWADKVTIVNAGTATATAPGTRVRSASFVPTDGRHYRIVTQNSSSKSTLSIYNAKIIVDQAQTLTAQITQDVSNSGDAWFGGSASSGEGQQADGQSFTPASNYSVSYIDIWMDRGGGSPSDSLYLELRSSSMTGTLLGTSSNVLGTSLPNNLNTGYVRFTFPTPVALTSGTKYYLPIQRTGARDGSNGFSTYFNNANPIASEDFYRKDNNVWAVLGSGNDLRFKVFSSVFITKLEPQYLLVNQQGYGNANDYDTKWDSTEWSGLTNNYYFAADGANGSPDDWKLRIAAAGADVTGSTLTNVSNQSISSALTMPASQDLESIPTSDSGQVYSSRIIVVTVISTGTNYTSTLTETITHTDTILKQGGKVLTQTIVHVDTVLKVTGRTLSDTLVDTDSIIIGKFYSSILSDILTDTDTLLKQGGKILSDTLTHTDTFIRSASRTLSDVLTHTDTVLKQAARIFSDTLTHTDTVFKQGGKVLSDTLTHVDTVLKQAARIFSDTLTHTDTVLKQVSRFLSDSITHTDTLTSLKITIKTLSDTLTHVDTLLKLPGRTLSDAITHTDTILKQAGRTLSDTLTNTDTFIGKITGRILTEVITHTDTILKLPGKILSDVLTHSDTILKQGGKVLSQTITHTDTVLKATGRLLSDAITHADTLIKTPGKILSDTTSFADTIFRTSSRTLSEAITHIDTALKQVGRTLSDTLNSTDTLIKTIAKNLTESVSQSDIFLKLTGRNFSEAVTNTDVISKSSGKIFSESLSVSDVIAKISGKVLSEAVSLLDTFERVINKVFSEISSYTDTFFKSFARVYSESIDHADTLIKQAGKELSDTLSLLAAFTRSNNSIFTTLTEAIVVSDLFNKLRGKILSESISLIDKLLINLNGQDWYVRARKTFQRTNQIEWFEKVSTIFHSKRVGQWYNKQTNEWQRKNPD